MSIYHRQFTLRGLFYLTTVVALVSWWLPRHSVKIKGNYIYSLVPINKITSDNGVVWGHLRRGAYGPITEDHLGVYEIWVYHPKTGTITVKTCLGYWKTSMPEL